jgi:hypothetical protein
MAWIWVNWHWQTWHGKDTSYSEMHCLDPVRSNSEQAMTACGVVIGRVASQIFSNDPPPKGACKRCVKAWRARNDLNYEAPR